MKQINIFILVFGIILSSISCGSYPKKNKTVKNLITLDSLTSIYLLTNKKFGYISYKGGSPFSNKYNKTKSRCSPTFIINESGFGNYSIKKNEIKLNFIKKFHPVEKMIVKKTSTSNMSEVLSIKIKLLPYVFKKKNEFNYRGLEAGIKSKDGTINLITEIDGEITFKVKKNQLPMEFMMNNNYSFVIKKKYNQEITLFINEFKKIVTKESGIKRFNLDNLINGELNLLSK